MTHQSIIYLVRVGLDEDTSWIDSAFSSERDARDRALVLGGAGGRVARFIINDGPYRENIMFEAYLGEGLVFTSDIAEDCQELPEPTVRYDPALHRHVGSAYGPTPEAAAAAIYAAIEADVL